MAITKLNSLAIPAGTVEPADISYPLTNFSSTGIDDNAASTALTIDLAGNVELNSGNILLNEGATGEASIGIKNGSSTGNQQASIVFYGEDNYYPGQVHIVSRSDNTGPTAGDISFWDYTGSTWNQNVTIKKDGKVGIGLHNPSTVLHLREAGTGSGEGDLILATASDGGNAGLRFRTGTSDRFSITTIGSAGSESLRIRDVNNNTERMRIDADGNVGINTSDPSALLDLGSSTGQKLLMWSNSNIKYGQAIETSEYRMFAEDLAVMTFGHMSRTDGTTYTERMRITNSGNVEVNGGAIYLNEGATGSSSIGIKNGSSVGTQQASIAFWGEDQSSYPGQVHIIGRSDNASTYAGDISFWDYTGSAWNQNVIIKKTGSVGIGTADPNALLHVGANGSTTRNSINIGTNYPSSGTRTGKITWRDSGNIVGQIDTNYDGTAVRMTISSLYQSGYNTADVMHIDPRGVTKPKNPAFLARHSSNTATGKIPFNNEAYDVGSNFDTTNNRFTAPVAGYYFFYMHTLTTYAYNGDTRCVFRKNGVQYTGNRHITNKQNWDTSHATALIYCAANDYVEAWFDGLPTSAASYSDSNYNGFFGFLVS